MQASENPESVAESERSEDSEEQQYTNSTVVKHAPKKKKIKKFKTVGMTEEVRKTSSVSQVSAMSLDEDERYESKISGHKKVLKKQSQVMYSLLQDEKAFRKLSFHPLPLQFSSFARAGILTKEVREHRRASTVRPTETRLKLRDSPLNVDGNHQITLNGIEMWFQQAKIFSTPQCKITVYDVRIMFQRFEKPSLTLSEFKSFILELAELRKIHPDIITFRLRLSGNPELDARLFHTTIPEGIMDRLVDAFRLEAEDGSEQFINLSEEAYREPICFGGMHRLFQAKSKEAEEARLTAEAKKIMKQGTDSKHMGKLQQNFIYFAKESNYYSDGRTMELTQLIRWMRQAGIVDGQNISTLDIGFLFKHLYTISWKIYFDDLTQILNELSIWKNIRVEKLRQKLRNCGEPASSSVSVITMSLKVSMLELLKKAVREYSDEFSEDREKYEPTTADTPYGHTPNSRNRHFANYLEQDPLKVHSTVMSDMGRGKKHEKSTVHGQQQLQLSQNGDEKEESFSEEKRNTKDLLAKRWHDAYPIGGMEVSNRPRTEPEFEKLMFGDDNDTDVSEDDFEMGKYTPKIYKGQQSRRSGSGSHRKSKESLYPPVPLEEQFEKYKAYGNQQLAECIMSRQLEIWFELAGVLPDLKSANSAVPKQEFESKVREFKRSDSEGPLCLSFEELKLFIEFFSEREGFEPRTLRNRLKRAGPPRAELYSRHRQSQLESQEESFASQKSPSEIQVKYPRRFGEQPDEDRMGNKKPTELHEDKEITNVREAQIVEQSETENVNAATAGNEGQEVSIEGTVSGTDAAIADEPNP